MDIKNRFFINWNKYAEKIYDKTKSKEYVQLKTIKKLHYEEFFEISINDRVLDTGCGFGEYSLLSLKDGAMLYAFDYFENMIMFARKNIKKEGYNAKKVFQANVLSIPFPDNCFDKVFCLNVIYHIEDQKKALSEIIRVLKPGGLVYLAVLNKYAIQWRIGLGIMKLFGLYPSSKIRYYSPSEILNLFRNYHCSLLCDSGFLLLPPFSGIYTSELKRFTIFPEWLIRILDKIHLHIEKNARKLKFLNGIFWQYFVCFKKNNSML